MKKFNKSLMAGLVAAGLVVSFGANATNGYFSHGEIGRASCRERV